MQRGESQPWLYIYNLYIAKDECWVSAPSLHVFIPCRYVIIKELN